MAKKKVKVKKLTKKIMKLRDSAVSVRGPNIITLPDGSYFVRIPETF